MVSEPLARNPTAGTSLPMRSHSSRATQRWRRLDQRRQRDGPQPGVERPVGERHGEHHVQQRQQQPGALQRAVAWCPIGTDHGLSALV
jgi:hypothetical protein